VSAQTSWLGRSWRQPPEEEETESMVSCGVRQKFDAGSTDCNKMSPFVTESPDVTNELVFVYYE
jgi:hypothetical protein